MVPGTLVRIRAGLPKNVRYLKLDNILDKYCNHGWGEGVLEIKVDLDVNTAEPGPFATDDDEEITITVEVIGFLANAFPVDIEM